MILVALLLDLFRQFRVALFQFFDLGLFLHQRGNTLRTAKSVDAESDHQGNSDRINAIRSKKISSLAWKIIVPSVGGCFRIFLTMTDKIVVLSTCASAEEAEKIARRLVELRLAACVNVLAGARSFYRWKDAIEDSGEWLLDHQDFPRTFRQTARRVGAAAFLRSARVVALPIVDGAPNYLNWLEAEMRWLNGG